MLTFDEIFTTSAGLWWAGFWLGIVYLLIGAWHFAGYAPEIAAQCRYDDRLTKFFTWVMAVGVSFLGWPFAHLLGAGDDSFQG